MITSGIWLIFIKRSARTNHDWFHLISPAIDYRHHRDMGLDVTNLFKYVVIIDS